MKSDLDILYSEVQERIILLENQIQALENTKEIIYRTELEARLREIINVAVRIQQLQLLNLHKTLSNFDINVDKYDGPYNGPRGKL